jgi:hypothetical protein
MYAFLISLHAIQIRPQEMNDQLHSPAAAILLAASIGYQDRWFQNLYGCDAKKANFCPSREANLDRVVRSQLPY